MDEPFGVAEVIKHGESCIKATLHRDSTGLSLRVRAHPCVEDFMRTIGGGEKVDVSTIGRHWTPQKGSSLVAYVIPQLDPIAGTRMTVDALGQPLFVPNQGGSWIGQPKAGPGDADVVNVSFLRLVGISEGIGVTFGVKGVSSLSALKKMSETMQAALRQFYIAYLQPIDLSISIERGTGQVFTQDVRY